MNPKRFSVERRRELQSIQLEDLHSVFDRLDTKSRKKLQLLISKKAVPGFRRNTPKAYAAKLRQLQNNLRRGSQQHLELIFLTWVAHVPPCCDGLPTLNELLTDFDNDVDFPGNVEAPPNSQRDIECFHYLAAKSQELLIDQKTVQQFYEIGYFLRSAEIEKQIALCVAAPLVALGRARTNESAENDSLHQKLKLLAGQIRDIGQQNEKLVTRLDQVEENSGVNRADARALEISLSEVQVTLGEVKLVSKHVSTLQEDLALLRSATASAEEQLVELTNSFSEAREQSSSIGADEDVVSGREMTNSVDEASSPTLKPTIAQQPSPSWEQLGLGSADGDESPLSAPSSDKAIAYPSAKLFVDILKGYLHENQVPEGEVVAPALVATWLAGQPAILSHPDAVQSVVNAAGEDVQLHSQIVASDWFAPTWYTSLDSLEESIWRGAMSAPLGLFLFEDFDRALPETYLLGSLRVPTFRSRSKALVLCSRCCDSANVPCSTEVLANFSDLDVLLPDSKQSVVITEFVSPYSIPASTWAAWRENRGPLSENEKADILQVSEVLCQAGFQRARDWCRDAAEILACAKLFVQPEIALGIVVATKAIPVLSSLGKSPNRLETWLKGDYFAHRSMALFRRSGDLYDFE